MICRVGSHENVTGVVVLWLDGLLPFVICDYFGPLLKSTMEEGRMLYILISNFVGNHVFVCSLMNAYGSRFRDALPLYLALRIQTREQLGSQRQCQARVLRPRPHMKGPIPPSRRLRIFLVRSHGVVRDGGVA